MIADQLSAAGTINLDDIGGVAGIPDDAAVSPLFPIVAEAIVAAFPALNGDEQQTGVQLLCAGVGTMTGGLALRTLCDVVVPAAPALGATEPLKDILRQRVNVRSDEANAALASVAVKALCHLALLESSARYILFDALGTIGSKPEFGVFATAAAWTAGVVFDRWREPAATDCLERLTTGEGEADASFWLGQTMLVGALELDDTEAIRASLRRTLEHFDRAAAMGEDRPDAVLYAAIVRFITEYGVGGGMTVLSEHLDKATSAYRDYLIDGTNLPDVPPWMRPRFDAEARWAELLQRLHAATHAEDRDAWYEAPCMIDGLADAYTSAHTLTPTRSYLAAGSKPAGIVDVVIPRIASPFIDNIVPLAFLDQWLDHTDHPDAARLRDEIAERCSQGANRGKARPAGDYPAVARHLGTISNVDPDLLARVEHALEDLEGDRIARTERVVTELLTSIHSDLAPCPDFTGDVRTHFAIIIDQVIRFLHLRMNAQRGSFGTRFAYLYDPNAHEDLLGVDLRDFISGNVAGVIHCEVQQLAGGRTDLIVQFGGFRITIELKREKEDVTQSGLAKYLPQLASYESTDVTLGMLIVLDLTDKPIGAANIRDNAWVAIVSGPNAGDRDRYAVVVRVPGNRKAPSAT